MAIVMRKGRPEDFDPTKMLPGEFAVTMGIDRRARKLYICFAPGIVKQLGTYEDFEDQIQDATNAIKQQYLMAFNEILTQIEADKNTAAEEYSYVVNFKNALEKTYIPSVTESVTAAANSAKAAATSESNASTYKNNAASSATAAANSAKAAATSESNANTYKNSASSSASTAESAKTAAETYKNNAQTYMNNAKNYMDVAKTAAASITGALKPKGTVTFANLPNINNVESGAMYNISTAFTSNSIFKDGGNITYPAGTNVYKTEDGMWDCLGGELSDYLMKADVDTAVEEAMPDYTASSSLQELVAGESIKSALGKIKTAVKNVISLVKLLGTTDISKIGNGTVTGAISTQASLITALNSNIKYSYDETAVCLYTTKSWSIGSGGYRWVCPSDGLYFLTSFFYFVDSLNVNEAYQFQMRVGEVLLAIYGGKDSWDGTMNCRMISALVPLRQGEVITPYVHINRENVRFNTKLYYCRIINK